MKSAVTVMALLAVALCAGRANAAYAFILDVVDQTAQTYQVKVVQTAGTHQFTLTEGHRSHSLSLNATQSASLTITGPNCNYSSSLGPQNTARFDIRTDSSTGKCKVVFSGTINGF